MSDCGFLVLAGVVLVLNFVLGHTNYQISG